MTPKTMFVAAAIFNLIAAVVLFEPFGIAVQLGVRPAPAGGPYENMTVAMIALFGVAYYCIASNPQAHRGVVALGLAGKLMVVSMVYFYAIWGNASLMFALIASGDLVFAALFAQFLRHHNRG